MPRTLSDLLTQEAVTLEADVDLEETLAQSVSDVVGLLPRSCLWEAATEVTVSQSGYSIGGGQVLQVHVDGHKAVSINPIEKMDWLETRSRAFTRRSRYGHYVLGGRLYIIELGSGAKAGKAFVVSLPSLVKKTMKLVAGFPSYRFTRLVAIWTAITLKERDARLIRVNDLPAVGDLTVGTLPTLPSAPSFTAVDAVVGSISATTVADPLAPTEPTVPVEPTVPAKPTVPTPPSATTIVATLPTDPAYTKVGPLVIPDDQATSTSSDWAAYMEEESPEILDRILRHFDAVTKEILANIQDENNEANVDVQVWLKTVDSLFAEAQLNHDFDQQTFKSEVDSFGAESTYEIQNFDVIFRNRIQKYAQQVQFELSLHQQKLDLNVEQARVTLQEQVEGARNNTQVNITNEAATLRALIDEYGAELNRFNADLQMYRFEGERQRGVVEGQVNIVEMDLRNLRIELQELRRRFVNALTNYVRTRRHGVSHQFMLHQV